MKYMTQAEVPGVARVNKKIVFPFLYQFLSAPIPNTLLPLAIPGLQLPFPYPPFSIKVFVDLPTQVPIKLPVKDTT